MTITVFFGHFLGIYLIVVGGLFLFRRASFTNAIVEMTESNAMLALAGFFALTLGTFLILANETWNDLYNSLVTLLGWAVFLKGIALLSVPRRTIRLWSRLKKFISVYAAIMILVGLYLFFAI